QTVAKLVVVHEPAGAVADRKKIFEIELTDRVIASALDEIELAGVVGAGGLVAGVGGAVVFFLVPLRPELGKIPIEEETVARLKLQSGHPDHAAVRSVGRADEKFVF